MFPWSVDLAAPSASFQQGTAIEIPGALAGERALENDTFVPVSARAAEKLADGDRALGALGVPPPFDGASRAATEACEAWYAALTESSPEELVACAAELSAGGGPVASAGGPVTIARAPALWPDPDRTLSRRFESVECAVARRLVVGGLVDAWRQRLAERSERALASAMLDLARLARVERDYPFTAAAARASLIACDRAFERGDSVGAARWLDRARLHSDGHAGDAGSRASPPGIPSPAAIASRAAGIAAAGIDTPRTTTSLSARALAIASTVSIEEVAGEPRGGRGLRAGVAALEDGSVVVQTAEHLVRVLSSGVATAVDLTALRESHGVVFGLAFADTRETWTLVPACARGRAVLVVGRARAEDGNACIAWDVNASDGLEWAYSSAGFRTRGAENVPLTAVLGAGVWEFEPRPVIDGTTVIVQARQWEGDQHDRVDARQVKSWVLAFDLATGGLVWKRWLAQGAALDADPGEARLAQLRGARGIAPAAEPLALSDGRVFAGTGVGIGALLDAVDGRVEWSFRTQRGKASRDPSFAWSTAAPGYASAALPASRGWAWSPIDSDFVYLLRDGSDSDGRGIALGRPESRAESAAVAGAGGDGVLLVRRLEDRACIESWEPITGRRSDAALFGREERVCDFAVPNETRALACTNEALYLLDRTRELAILDRLALPPPDRTQRRSMCTRGDRAWVLDASRMYVISLQ